MGHKPAVTLYTWAVNVDVNQPYHRLERNVQVGEFDCLCNYCLFTRDCKTLDNVPAGQSVY